MNLVKVSYESGKLRHEITVGRHHLIADEPLELGGEDTGPAPFDYLCAALGACTAITLRMYAQRKAWPLQNTEVRVEMQRTPEATQFIRKISLLGALSDEQKNRLLDIANHCPVHKVLAGKIGIETSLV